MLAGVGLTDAEAEVYAAVLGTRAAVDRLMGLYRKANRTRTAADFVEMISGAETIANQVDQVHQIARTQVRVFDKPPYARNPDQHRQSTQDEIRVGVSYRILYDRAALAWPGRLVNDILPRPPC